MENTTMPTCRKCGAHINLAFGADSPAEHSEAEGTIDDPRAPGDRDDICANCDYDPDPTRR